MLKGEVDLIQGNLPPEIVQWLDKKDIVRIQKRQSDTFTYLGFNLEDVETGNKLVRSAIAHAIDRAVIIKYIKGGVARKASTLFYPLIIGQGPPALKGIAYAPETARMLLAQAGYSRVKNQLG